MRTEYIIIVLLFIHWVSDFVLQTDKMAQGKSKNFTDLISHTSVYSLVFGIGICILIISGITKGEPLNIFPFISITFVAHTIQDYITSRINSKLWAEKKVHWFFVSIGIDQFFHFVQLILTYKLLFNGF